MKNITLISAQKQLGKHTADFFIFKLSTFYLPRNDKSEKYPVPTSFVTQDTFQFGGLL